MSELIKLEKPGEMLKEIKRKANRMFTFKDAVRSHECIAIVQLIDEELERRNTRTASPRFTAEEREAMSVMVSNYDCNEDGLGCDSCFMNTDELPDCKRSLTTWEEWQEKTNNAIATVRKMLEGSV